MPSGAKNAGGTRPGAAGDARRGGQRERRPSGSAHKPQQGWPRQGESVRAPPLAQTGARASAKHTARAKVERRRKRGSVPNRAARSGGPCTTEARTRSSSEEDLALCPGHTNDEHTIQAPMKTITGPGPYSSGTRALSTYTLTLMRYQVDVERAGQRPPQRFECPRRRAGGSQHVHPVSQ